jgi:hypothetical protein
MATNEVNLRVESSSSDLEELIPQCEQLKVRYEELFAFVYGLRDEGFRFSPTQFVDIQKLLVLLVSGGEIKNDLPRLKTYLAPLLCSSPEGQENFYKHFDRWLKTHQPPEQSGNRQSVPDIPKSDKTAQENKSKIKIHWLVVISFLIFASLIILYLLTPSTEISGIVRDNANKQTISNAKITFNEQTQLTDSQGRFSLKYPSQANGSKILVEREGYQPVEMIVETNAPVDIGLARLTPTPTPTFTATPIQTPTITPLTPTPTLSPTPAIPLGTISFYNRFYVWLLIGVFVLPFAVYGLWQLAWLLRRRQLERWRDKEKPDLNRIMVKGTNAGKLYRSPRFRKFAQELRRHRRISSKTLDAELSVAATLSKGGFFTPVYGVRQLTPEYLTLIDRLSFRDQKARLEDEMIARLRKEGVFVDRYYFNGDPRVCWKEDRKTKYFSLDELAFKHPEHRLLIFSDGAGLIDRFSNQPQHWLNLLSVWDIRALLSPNPVWGYNEWILEKKAMLPVIPAREADLPALLEVIRKGEVDKDDDFSALEDYPHILLGEPTQWLTETPKSPAELAILRLELSYYLGLEGYNLFCACAVYPALSWDLTFYLGHQLIESSCLEETLEKLVLLPWFRNGVIPDWLRQELLSDLLPEDEAKIRHALEQLLISYLDNPNHGFELEIARKSKDKKILFERLRGKFNNFRRRRFFYDVVKTEKPDSQLREHVFLRFVSGSKLAVAIPRRLNHALSALTERTSLWKSGILIGIATISKGFLDVVRGFYNNNNPVLGLDWSKALVLTGLISIIAGTTLLLLPPRLIPAVLQGRKSGFCPAETRPFPSYDKAFGPSEEWCRNNPDTKVFRLSQNYLEAKNIINEELPWKKFAAKTDDLKANWKDYLFSVLRYAYEGNIEKDWIVQENPVRKWYHAPWMHTTQNGTEFLHGLHRDRNSCLKELTEGVMCEDVKGRTIQNWGISFYNEPGGYYIGKVWREMYNADLDASKPNPKPHPKAFGDEGFPEGTVAIQMFFTEADLDYLKNSIVWEADINRGKTPPQKVRLLQVNISVKDSISPTGWVFGTFIHHDDAPEMEYYPPLDEDKKAWLKLVPVGIMFGADAGEFPELKEPFETYLNDSIPVPQHYGCGKRLNGPVDNARSSCISCHALAEVAQDFSRISFAERMDCATEENVKFWFKNINPSSKNADERTFSKSMPIRKIFSLDYSLQLSEGIRRCCDANVCQCRVEDVLRDGVF